MQALAGTEIGVFAQSCHWEPEGAFTGEVAAPMLNELGVYGTMVGHSERRLWFGETDETVARRARGRLDGGPARDRLRRRDRSRSVRRARLPPCSGGRCRCSSTTTTS